MPVIPSHWTGLSGTTPGICVITWSEYWALRFTAWKGRTDLSQVRVLQSYTAAYPDPICLEAGDFLEIDASRTSEWPGWVWGRADSGTSGWVPAEILDQCSSRISVREAYSAAELTVSGGEILDVLKERAGWLWCAAQNGKQGWLPARNVIPYGGNER